MGAKAEAMGRRESASDWIFIFSRDCSTLGTRDEDDMYSNTVAGRSCCRAAVLCCSLSLLISNKRSIDRRERFQIVSRADAWIDVLRLRDCHVRD